MYEEQLSSPGVAMYIPIGAKELRSFMAGRLRSKREIDGISRDLDMITRRGEGW
jgi:hypothetical protein